MLGQDAEAAGLAVRAAAYNPELPNLRLQLASSHPGEPLWYQLAARSRSPVNNPG